MPSTAAMRRDLALLRARYDSGAVQPGVYEIIRAIEIEIAWAEHADVERRWPTSVLEHE
jgi:hypothetical protein